MSERPAAPLTSAEACEAAFYAAFEAADLEAMMALWSSRSPLLCIHPAGPALTSREDVARSWRLIFRGGGGIRFAVDAHCTLESADLVMRSVQENIHQGPGFRELSVVLATNVYVLEDGEWRMCVHHASPTAAADSRDTGGPVH